MKRTLLFFCFPLLIQTAEPPPKMLPLRTDSLGSSSVHLVDLASKSRQPDIDSNRPIPRSIPIVELQNARKPLKMVTVSVNVWHNDPCDKELWEEILQEYYKLKNTPFNPQELFAGITAFIKLTEEKKGNALWGGLSFTEVPDSQRIDNKKAPEKP